MGKERTGEKIQFMRGRPTWYADLSARLFPKAVIGFNTVLLLGIPSVVGAELLTRAQSDLGAQHVCAAAPGFGHGSTTGYVRLNYAGAVDVVHWQGDYPVSGQCASEACTWQVVPAVSCPEEVIQGAFIVTDIRSFGWRRPEHGFSGVPHFRAGAIACVDPSKSLYWPDHTTVTRTCVEDCPGKLVSREGICVEPEPEPTQPGTAPYKQSAPCF